MAQEQPIFTLTLFEGLQHIFTAFCDKTGKNRVRYVAKQEAREEGAISATSMNYGVIDDNIILFSHDSKIISFDSSNTGKEFEVKWNGQTSHKNHRTAIRVDNSDAAVAIVTALHTFMNAHSESDDAASRSSPSPSLELLIL